VHNLVAATYGRGIWMAPLWTAGLELTTATATPATLTFASQIVDSTSAAQTVTVKNTGSIALTPTSVVASGDFSETDNCLNANVAAGGSCAIQVVFAPTQAGSRTGTMTIGANVPGGNLTVSLSGTGAPSGAVGLSPASVGFGSWQVGTTSNALQVTANNSGSQAVAFTSAITGQFAIASNACGASIPANGCNLTLIFTPAQIGAATGELTFTDAEGTQTVQLSGTGLAPPTDDLSPASLTFSGTVAGQLSAAQTVTLTNNGGVQLKAIAISVSGPFRETNACTTNLAPESNCGISVVYAPTQAGSQTGTLTVSDLLHTQTVALSGTGIAPAVIGVSPASLSFNGQQVGVASAPQTLTVSNIGGSPMADVGFEISGLSAASFSIGLSTCGATLANGASCTVQVLFTPAAAGGATASLAVSSSTSGVAPVSVPLTGTGAACLCDGGSGQEQRVADGDGHQYGRLGGQFAHSDGYAAFQPSRKHLRREPCRRGKLLDGRGLFTRAGGASHGNTDHFFRFADAGKRAAERNGWNAGSDRGATESDRLPADECGPDQRSCDGDPDQPRRRLEPCELHRRGRGGLQGGEQCLPHVACGWGQLHRRG
jgi:hypothetical protein